MKIKTNSLAGRFWPKSAFAAVVSFAVIGMGGIAQGAVIATDLFTYTNGNFNGNNGGTGFNTTWGTAGGNTAFNNPAVTGGVVQVTDDRSHRGLTTTFGSTGEIWISIDYAKINLNTTDYAGLSLFAGTAERFLVGSVDQGNGTGAHNSWVIGQPGPPAAFVVSSVSAMTTIQTGVVRLTLGAGTTGTASLWVGAAGSPVNVSGTAAVTTTGLNLTGVNTIRLASSGTANFDNFIMGNTFTDIGAIPEPSAALLGGLGLLALLRRRRH